MPTLGLRRKLRRTAAAGVLLMGVLLPAAPAGAHGRGPDANGFYWIDQLHLHSSLLQTPPAKVRFDAIRIMWVSSYDQGSVNPGGGGYRPPAKKMITYCYDKSGRTCNFTRAPAAGLKFGSYWKLQTLVATWHWHTHSPHAHGPTRPGAGPGPGVGDAPLVGRYLNRLYQPDGSPISYNNSSYGENDYAPGDHCLAFYAQPFNGVTYGWEINPACQEVARRNAGTPPPPPKAFPVAYRPPAPTTTRPPTTIKRTTTTRRVTTTLRATTTTAKATTTTAKATTTTTKATTTTTAPTTATSSPTPPTVLAGPVRPS